jgi:hypothetical protein
MEITIASVVVRIVVGAVWGVGSGSSTATLCVHIVSVEMPALAVSRIARPCQVITTPNNGCWNGRCGAEATIGGDALTAALFVNQHDHPDADCASVA